MRFYLSCPGDLVTRTGEKNRLVREIRSVSGRVGIDSTYPILRDTNYFKHEKVAFAQAVYRFL